MADVGNTTIVRTRTQYASPPVAASGPTPGTPVTTRTQASSTQIARAVGADPGVHALSPRRTSSGTFAVYTMVGTDAATNDRDTWESVGFIDTTASQYAGALATPLRDVHVLSRSATTV